VINILLIAPNPTVSSGTIESGIIGRCLISRKRTKCRGDAKEDDDRRHGIAKALGLEVPGQVQQLADELIE
jgi:hypothetical protein